MEQVTKKQLARPLMFSMLVAYLALLGYWHFTRPIDPEDLLAEDFEHQRVSRVKQAFASRPSTTPPPLPEPRDEVRIVSGTLPSLAPPSQPRADQYTYYKELASRYGQRVTGLTVIGVRGLAPNGARHASEDNATPYDDTFVVLNPGRENAIELLGSTHAGQLVSSLSPAGVAQIKPGRYVAHPGGVFAEMDCWLVTTRGGSQEIPCLRDRNGNGFIDPAEVRSPSIATEILFHNGRYDAYGSSIGCQVLPPWNMEIFINRLGPSTVFDFLLIDANRPIP